MNELELLPKEPTFKSKPVKIKSRRKRAKRFLIKTAIILIVLTSGLIYGSYKVNEFFKTNELKFQSPLRMPVLVVPRGHEASKPEISLLPEAYAKVADGNGEDKGTIDFSGANFIERTNGEDKKVQDIQTPIAEIVSKVHLLESSGGKNDSCKAKGQYNGYGFIPGTCYKTQAEVTKLVTNWFEDSLTRNNLPTALCGYNLGFHSKHLSECINKSDKYPYYLNFLQLNK